MMSTKTRYIGYKEAAEYLSVSQATLRRYVMLDRIPHCKPFGKKGRTLFDINSLDAFVHGLKEPAPYRGNEP